MPICHPAFPLAVAFTPVMAGAGEQHFLQQSAPLSAQRTQVYTLEAGDTAASVAKKFHLPLDQLREINQLRTFAHGLNGLLPGDNVDVPLMSVKDKKTISGTSTASPSTDGISASVPEGDEQAQKVAGYASQAGSFLAGSAKSDAAASMARDMATGEAGVAFQQWLSHFGTARIQLEADKNFSLKNSQFDLLMPLYDQGDNLVFTQGSLHRADGRTQANLGAGLRHFMPGYMLGGNLFWDYDLSREHVRMGGGLEYWRDFLKLGANGYMRLTGWKDSPDLADYQERPANGWDIRAQAWVPALPQLGGKLTYEQYYGKEVALFGMDNRQKNPYAITAGINYTPVPLITLGGEQRQGQSGKSDSRLTVDMNYQLGVPWRQQVDPDAVAAMRTLTGSRYDLVERNNYIVLEYRKKDSIRLKTADLVTGHAGEQKPLGVSVTSKYGLERIDWDATALTAAGGKIVQNGADYAVVLPAYQSSVQGVNTYTGFEGQWPSNPYHESDLEIREHYTDTAGFTDHVFALMHLLGFAFCPRIRDLHDKKLFIKGKADQYPALQSLISTNSLNLKEIEIHWREVLRLAISIKQGTVTASLMLKKLASYPKQNGLAKALREIGRIERTLFMLDWFRDPALRRRVQAGLNKGEARNALARAVFLHRLGEIRDRKPENQNYRASGLTLLTAAISLWNTVYMERAVDALKRKGVRINEQLLSHLSPLGWEHINLTGDYIWKSNRIPASGKFRRLRPAKVERSKNSLNVQ